MPSLNRVVMNRASRCLIEALRPESLDVAEISGKWVRSFPFKTYRAFRYPDFDICAGPLPPDGSKKFDLVLATRSGNISTACTQPPKTSAGCSKRVGISRSRFRSISRFTPTQIIARPGLREGSRTCWAKPGLTR